jgi:hypothetical protein
MKTSEKLGVLSGLCGKTTSRPTPTLYRETVEYEKDMKRWWTLHSVWA